MQDFNKINRETYDTISIDWNEKRKYDWKPVVTFLESNENKEKLKLLDLGCGTARHLELAEKLGFANKNLIGCDFSSGQLEIVKKKGFKTKLSNLENLDFKSEEFDIIICIAAHHHLLEKEEQLRSLKEIRRILKQEGKLLLCNWFPEKEFINKQLKKKKFEFIDNEKKKVKVTYTFENKKYDRYYYLFEKEELENLCKNAGFKILNTEVFNGNIYFILQ